MRRWTVLATLLVAACGSDPPPAPVAPAPPPASVAPAPAPPPPPPPEEKTSEIPDTANDEEEVVESVPEPAPQAPSTASFEQATSTPEPIRSGDDHLHLTDQQLSGPMRGAIAKCKVPPRARVTIKTAVQFGHAIGVTVIVELPKLKTPKKPTKESQKAAKAHQKTMVRVRNCVDHEVRVTAWPPSRRRDTIITTF